MDASILCKKIIRILRKLEIKMKKIFFLILIIIFSISCEKAIDFSKVPQIELKEITFKKAENILQATVKRTKITFSVIDGDGDFGLENSHIDSTSYYNLYTTLYAKIDGEFEEVDVEIPNFRTPFIEVQGRNKVLKATVIVLFDYPRSQFIETLPYDTIKYEFFVVDRALNKSNIIETPIKIFNEE